MSPELEDAHRPSPTARRRLAAQLRREIADARVRLDEATLRSDAHLLAGDVGGADQAVRDQREVLRGLHERLRRIVAGAAVEREAEGVVAAADRRDRVDEPSGRPLATIGAVMGVVLAVLLGLLPRTDVGQVAAVWSAQQSGPPESAAPLVDGLVDGRVGAAPGGAETDAPDARDAADSVSPQQDTMLLAAEARERRESPTSSSPLVDDYVTWLTAAAADQREAVEDTASDLQEGIDAELAETPEVPDVRDVPDVPDLPATTELPEQGAEQTPPSAPETGETPQPDTSVDGDAGEEDLPGDPPADPGA